MTELKATNLQLTALPASITTDKDTGVKEVIFAPAYSGGYLNIAGLPAPVVIDLSTASVHPNLPILLYHDETRRVGMVVENSIQDGFIAMRGNIYTALPDSQTVLAVHQNGGKWECSIGTGVVEAYNQEYIAEGVKIDINNQSLTGPLIKMSNVEIRELSFVCAGADSYTDVSIKATALINPSKGTPNMEKTFEDYCAELGLNVETLDAENKEALMAKFEEEAVEETVEEAIEATADEEEEEPAVAVKASGLTQAVNRLNGLLTVSRPAPARPAEGRVIEASMLLRQGVNASALEKVGYTQNELNEAMSAGNRELGLHSIMRRAVKASGLVLPTDCSNSELVALYRDALQASALSTRDFSPSGVMSNVADKLLRIKSDQINSIAEKVLYKRSVRNFNSVSTGSLQIMGGLNDVEPGADFPVAAIKESANQLKITKRGCRLAITVEDQYNDDLGAFDRALSEFDRIFANAREKAVFESLISRSATLFTTGNGKKTTKALSAANLKDVVGKFARIKDADGGYRNLQPGAILTSPETAMAAKAIFEFNDKAVLATDAANLFTASYAVYGTPYISDAQGWYLLPRDEYIGEIAFLNGNSAPTVEQARINPDNLSIEYTIWGTCGSLIYDDAAAIYNVPSA